MINGFGIRGIGYNYSMLTFLTIGHAYGTPAGDDLYETEIPNAHTRIQEIANAWFEGGFVHAPGTGFWQGNREGTTCVMVAGAERQTVEGFANAIKENLKQDAVGVFEIESQISFI